MNEQETALEKASLFDRTTFGFWLYLMTDCILFASLFAVFVVLRPNTNGGPSGQDIFNMPYILSETLILLTSSFACGLGVLAARQKDKNLTLIWFGITLILGLAFLGLELSEFHKLALDGNSWRRSGFLSGYFTLVGTHGLHITAGLIWMTIMLARVKKALTVNNLRRLVLLSLFWHFLDVVWIFIFTVVYLMGAIPV